MAHLSTTALHEIQYGFRPPPPHVEGCGSCRATLDLIREEQEGLRSILQKDAQDAAIPMPVVRPAAKRPPLGRSLAAFAAAAAFIGILLFVLDDAPPAGRHGSDPDAEKTFRRIEAMIAGASSLRIRYVREVPPTTLGSGELLLGEGNRVKLVIRRPISPPGGIDDEFVTISDGREVVNQVRSFGFVSLEGKEQGQPDLKAKIARGIARTGLCFAEALLPGASQPYEASHWLWKMEDAHGFKAEGPDGEAQVLSYRIDGGSEGGVFKLWYDPRTLRPLRLLKHDNVMGTTVETYDEFSVGIPLSDEEFAFPPGKEEEGLHGTPMALEEYLKLAAAHAVREVWMEYGQLVAHLTDGIRRDGKLRRQVWVRIPSAFLRTPDGLRRLSEGVRADRVHVARNLEK